MGSLIAGEYNAVVRRTADTEAILKSQKVLLNENECRELIAELSAAYKVNVDWLRFPAIPSKPGP